MSGRFHIITGGPGSGKTTLIQHLSTQGFHCMPETGRAIIRDEVANDGSALPWADRAAFAAKMFTRELHAYKEAGSLQGQVIFDRGLPDIVGYLQLCGLDVPVALMHAAEVLRYAERVFIAPHWPAIYEQDAERQQGETEAKATFEAMVQAYTSLGYQLVHLPLVSVEERAAFIRSRIDA
jgi:predicted ATPase